LKKLNELETLKKNAIDLNLIKCFKPLTIDELAKLTFEPNEDDKNNQKNISNTSVFTHPNHPKFKFKFKKEFPLEKSFQRENIRLNK